MNALDGVLGVGLLVEAVFTALAYQACRKTEPERAVLALMVVMGGLSAAAAVRLLSHATGFG